MALYNIVIMPSVEKDLKYVPLADRRRILKRISGLAENLRPHGCKKLAGKDRYCIRQGDYRILYEIKDKELVVWIINVGHRKEVYKAREERAKYLAEKKSLKNKT